MLSFRSTVLFLCFVSSTVTASSSRIPRANTDIATLSAAVDLFKADVGRYPSVQEGLGVLVAPSTIKNYNPGGYLKALPIDPWGRPYRYESPGPNNTETFDLWSYGADGLPGGDGFDADIGNWLNGYTAHDEAQAAMWTQRRDEEFYAFTGIGIVFWLFFYLGISFIRLSDGIGKRRSFTGKSLWISLALFILYLVLTFPLIA